MTVGEFDLIRRFFSANTHHHAGTLLGIGDDCALIHCRAGMSLAVTVDTLVSGVHFLPDVAPESLGHKALAVNLSDLAAMGAEPAWATLALSLPDVDEAWLAAFARGFFTLAGRHGLQLIGGDTTRGPLSITIQVIGQVPADCALRRSGAKVGDIIYVSGSLGAAGLGLKMRLGQHPNSEGPALSALEWPEPRIGLGQSLQGIASACIDISDGLAADLGHILTASQVGACIDVQKLPLLPRVRDYITLHDDWRLPLTAGDDYELCFTVPHENLTALTAVVANSGLSVSAIGRIEAEPGLRVLYQEHYIHLNGTGYDHFKHAESSQK
jgi:thiamine-monophosphate kinase